MWSEYHFFLGKPTFDYFESYQNFYYYQNCSKIRKSHLVNTIPTVVVGFRVGFIVTANRNGSAIISSETFFQMLQETCVTWCSPKFISLWCHFQSKQLYWRCSNHGTSHGGQKIRRFSFWTNPRLVKFWCFQIGLSRKQIRK